jgi:RNA polymerase sigma factor (sigma-70 family)
VTLDPATLRRLYASAEAARWSVPHEEFGRTLASSLAKAFEGEEPTTRDQERYLAALHLKDLALACACALGHDEAWEHFVREHRPTLYRAADVLDPSGGARETADALYADLYGMAETDGTRRSLFRYFHGRSRLGTWLRAVLAQRHVDVVRARRRLEPLPGHDEQPRSAATSEPDPDRPRLRAALLAALAAVVAGLAPQDRFRLRAYYGAGMTLAQIGRLTGEHEATVSRQLKRTRAALRERTERRLRDEAGLRDAEVARCFEIAVEVDPGSSLDVQDLLGAMDERKSEPAGRST